MGEVTISFGTRNFREAEHLATRLDDASEGLFSGGMYDSAKVTAALKAELSRMMDEGRRRVIAGAYGLADGHEHAERGQTAATEAASLEQGIRLYEDVLRTRDLRGPEPAIRKLMAAHGIPEGAFAEFGLGYAQASLDSLKQRHHWLQHGLFDFSEPSAPGFDTISPKRAPEASPEAPTVTAPLRRGGAVHRAFQGWLAGADAASEHRDTPHFRGPLRGQASDLLRQEGRVQLSRYIGNSQAPLWSCPISGWEVARGRASS